MDHLNADDIIIVVFTLFQNPKSAEAVCKGSLFSYHCILLNKWITCPFLTFFYSKILITFTIHADTIMVNYWESLQVKAHPQFGYKTMVGVFDIKNDTILVAISKTLSNPQFGDGGVWYKCHHK